LKAKRLVTETWKNMQNSPPAQTDGKRESSRKKEGDHPEPHAGSRFETESNSKGVKKEGPAKRARL